MQCKQHEMLAKLKQHLLCLMKREGQIGHNVKGFFSEKELIFGN